MQTRIVVRSLLLFLITTCVTLALQSSESPKRNEVSTSQSINRDKRLIFKHNQKPGFFRTLFSVIYEQYSDTKNTFNKVNTLINDNFAPEEPKGRVAQTTTVKSETNVSTTAAPFKIKRSDFNKIVRRNLRGLARLINIELRDAFRISNTNYDAYKKNASLEISKFL